jgi:predicted aspartyl protease
VIHYGYNQQVTPPAPFVHVTIRCVETGREVSDFPAQIDTAADRTVVPMAIIEDLGVVPLDELPVSGIGGQVLLLSTFRVQLSLRRFTGWTIEVLAHPQEPFVLLGRDILNRYRILLDGPQLALEIS